MPEVSDLTPRQLEVLRMRAAGITQYDVARRLGISEQTVKNTSRDAYARLDVSGLAEAMNKLGWVQVDRKDIAMRLRAVRASIDAALSEMGAD